ncbi:MAG: methylmalonyl Co-A mutase-associated GTPase MeaB [Chloroflexi bacterium]|nr:methylmalonyl Co-A mutase-associated GTPase MeaB [Chloroflexota bacterium]
MIPELVQRMRSGDRRALARLLTLIEPGGIQAAQVLEAVHPYTGHAYFLGITGPPGAGKSTLIEALIDRYRTQGLTVGIVCVDPTSPFSGGAFLGDRIRMQRHYLDTGVFIRSMATRGSTGGLPRMIKSALRVMDASQKDIIIVETVGVGQTEVEIMRVVDTVTVVLVPEAGDAIQALKAGLLEIADIFVVNKADRPNAGRMVTDLEAMLNLAETAPWWRSRTLLTKAHEGEGIDTLFQTIQEHRAALEGSFRLKEKRLERQRREFLTALEEELGAQLHRLVEQKGGMASILAQVQEGRLDPFAAAMQVLNNGSLLQEWLESLKQTDKD